jgi:sucrose-phosphate synthase
MLEQGIKPEVIESQYNISQRIEAEEEALDNAQLVIASTHQEVEEQYSQYDNYQPKRMLVIPPGVDLERFRPPKRQDPMPAIADQVERFLHHPERPMILALSRPDERKNVETLLRAYGEHAHLRSMANLVVVLGNRDDIRTMDSGPRGVLTNVLLLIDHYDLYGVVAIPKHHQPEDVPELYRLAARRKGIFVNPALTEPFGLTLIEAAASGVPILATQDGGPRDIIAACKNGELMDPLDAVAMGAKLEAMLSDRARWNQWSRNGLHGAKRHYSWASHVKKYLSAVQRIQRTRRGRLVDAGKSRLPTVEKLFICALDNTLLGDPLAVDAFIERLRGAGPDIGFGIATGRNLDSTRRVIGENGLPMPDLLITSVGAEIHYGHQMVKDQFWTHHIDHRWEPEALREALDELPGLRLQPPSEQHRFKISYFLQGKKAPSMRDVRRFLRRRDLHANVIQSRGMFLDVVPVRVSKGLALRYLSGKWGIMPESILVAGGCGNDDDLLRGNMLGVVVANHGPELTRLKGRPRIYFAHGEHAWGVMEGIDYYNFFGDIHVPQEEVAEE